jgi:hypothetical protein
MHPHDREGGPVTDPRELLQLHGAPTPLARPMPTEVRTDGGLVMQLLQAPYWAGPDGNPVIAEWRCALTLQQVLALRTFLVRPDPATGMQPEAAIDVAMKDFGIGAYLGTFVTEGPNFNDVRMLFAYRPNEMITEAALNQLLFDLLRNVRSNHLQAATALRYLRDLWNTSPVRTDTKLMMLSQVDVLGSLRNPQQSPYTANQLNP